MAETLQIVKWKAEGFRCPDHEIIFLGEDDKIRPVTLIQMPNGTGKTTTLELLRAALSGSASEGQWSKERIEPGTYEGTASYLVASNEVRVTYKKKDIRHHDFTWSYLKHIVSQLHALTGMDGVMRDRFQQYIGSDNRPSWPCPSDTRNRWNYEAASLFGTKGELSGAEFKKLSNNKTAAYKWAKTEQKHDTDDPYDLPASEPMHPSVHAVQCC